MHQITIDLSNQSVSLRYKDTYRSPLHGQWVHFYLALALRALAPKDPLFLEVHELMLLKPWFNKKPGSVGKEVARHLQELSDWGMEGLVVHDGRTKRWRLNLSPEEIDVRPSREQCERWLREERFDLLDRIEDEPLSLVPWLTHITQAVIRLEKGEIEEGRKLTAMAKHEHGGSALLGAVTELVELRLSARVEEYPDPGDYFRQYEGSIGKALEIRAKLAQALAPTSNLEGEIERFRKLAFRLENLPDINGLGTLYNALGVLFRRSDQLDQAKKCLRYAAALLVASFDLPTLQATLFNLGHSIYKAARSEKDLREAVKLIKLDREIFSALGVGGDSAQAEVVAGTISLELGDLVAARQWLDAGQQIVEKLSSNYNRGCIEELQARYRWAQEWHDHQGLQPSVSQEIVGHYEQAQWYLSCAGHTSQSLVEELKMVKRGTPPPWLKPKWRDGDSDLHPNLA